MFYPSDAVATERAVELAANTKVIKLYIIYNLRPQIERKNVT